jgi:hypothetical protein
MKITQEELNYIVEDMISEAERSFHRSIQLTGDISMESYCPMDLLGYEPLHEALSNIVEGHIRKNKKVLETHSKKHPDLSI